MQALEGVDCAKNDNFYNYIDCRMTLKQKMYTVVDICELSMNGYFA